MRSGIPHEGDCVEGSVPSVRAHARELMIDD